MKTIGGIIAILLLVIVMVNGMNEIFTQAGSKGYLDTDSVQIISLYDSRLKEINSNFTANYDSAKGLTNYEPNNNYIGNEVKEYFDHKSRLDQIRETLNMAYKLPDLLFMSLPFVDYEETALYRNIAWFFIWFAIVAAIITALGQRQVTED